MKASKNGEAIEYCIACDLDKYQHVDVCFQDLYRHSEYIESEKCRAIVLMVPFCNNSDEIRLNAKKYRKEYGVNKCFLMDVNETYPIHKRQKLPHNQIVDSVDLAVSFLGEQGYEVI